MRITPTSKTVAAGSAGVVLLATVMARPARAVISVPCDASQLVTAIQSANAAPNGDTLSLASSCTYTLTTAFGGTTGGLPPIVKPVTVQGNGATITRSPSAGVFRIFEVDTGGSLTVTSLTISGGHAAGPAPAGDGGGIYAHGGQVRLTSSTVGGNVADHQGGGIWTAGPLTLNSTTVHGNAAASTGGGILATGSSTLNSTGGTIDDNAALFGGGVANNGTAVLTNTAISGNVAFGGNASGGGVINFRSFRLTNGNVNGNIALGAGAQGGGIVNSAGTLTLVLTAVAANTSTAAPGGIFNNSGTVSLTSSPIGGNQPTNCSPSPVTGCTG